MLQVRNIAIDLDSLFDTRLGTLTVISADFAARVGGSERYYRRESDIFSTKEQGELSVETYDQVRKALANEVLANSMPTRMIKFLKELAVSIIDSTQTKGLVNDLEIHLLTSEYSLSAQEHADLAEMVSQFLNGSFVVKINEVSFKDLTPESARSHYHSMIFYDPQLWINHHERALRDGQTKNLTVYAPDVVRKRNITEQQKRYMQMNHLDINVYLKKFCEPMFRLELCPVGLFSADLPPNKS